MKYKVGQRVSFSFDGVTGDGVIVNIIEKEADSVYNIHVFNGTSKRLGNNCLGKLHSCGGRVPKGYGWNILERGILSVENNAPVLDKILNGG